jgi:uncharacterized protein (TIGR03083 family)
MNQTKQAIMEELQGARQELVELVQSLDAESLARQTCNEGWCVKDIIAHLAASEAGLKRLADLASKGESRPRSGFDLHAYNREQVELRRGRSVEELLSEMAESRVATLGFLEAVPDEHLDRMGRLSSGLPLTAGQILRRIAEHERQHTEEIRAAIPASRS